MAHRYHRHTLSSLLSLSIMLVGFVAAADEPEPAPPLPAPPPPPTAPPVEAGLVKDHKDEDLKPTPKPDAAKPTLKVGIGLRTGLSVNVNNPSDKVLVYLDDGLIDQANMRPYFTADLNEHVSFFSSFEIGTRYGLGQFNILDAVVQLKLIPEFQVWVGQHIAANDRNNMNGPFFGNGWNFAITVPSYSFDTGARDRGVTFWGLIAGGRLKYHASAVDLQPGGTREGMSFRGQTFTNARYAGRVTVHLWEPEDFYYNSGTYFGKKDVLAFGAVVNYQKGPELMPGIQNDFFGYSFDAFMEKNLGPTGTITLELGYWDFKKVDAMYVTNQGTRDSGVGFWGPLPGRSFMASASWLSPSKLGMGYLQPNVRWQWADYEGQMSKWNTFDVGLGYIVDGFNHRWYLNFRHNDTGVTDDIFQIGAQIMM